MKISLFLSVEESRTLTNSRSDNVLFIGRQAALACASEKFAANCVPMFSSLSAKPGSDNFHTESGCRIDLLSDAENRLPDVLYLWKRLQDMLKIHCMYIEVRETSGIVYSGCICDWPYYRTDYRRIHAHVHGPITCTCGSEEAKSDNPRPGQNPLNVGNVPRLPDHRIRYGKPLC